MQIRTMQIEDYDAVFALWKSCSGMGLNDVDDSRSGIAVSYTHLTLPTNSRV